ncbi:S-layer homology domain-containing protein [Neglectibacter caecimuris]|uniref:RCC1 domain-containing protein n=1 Tax=Neglectibacter caecimuris TaxID=3093658 RepID=UPI002AC9267F|nr:S-layer homology domain-containing protein [Neglectibacter sp. M00184]
MKQNSHHPSGGKLRGLFCLGLAAVLAAGIALNSTAAGTAPTQYDISVWSSPTHTAALSGDTLYFWGTNERGQFPGSELVYSPEPTLVQRGVKDASVSVNRTLTVSSDGQLRSYGIEPATDIAAPKDGLVLARNVAQVEAEDLFAAYIDKKGALYTWGQNGSFQLGTGSVESSAEPIRILDSGVKKVSLGNSFGLALLDDGSVYGWGNISSLLPDSDENSSEGAIDHPVKIAENTQDISTGKMHACLLKKDGSLWAGGDNTFSQIGIEDYSSNGLTQVMAGIRCVSAGSYHNFAVSNDGAVYAWGYGMFGQLGSGNTERYSTPTETSFDFVQLFACSDNTFGVSTDGSLYSFGNNTNYRLGKSNGSDSLLPVRILDQKMNWVYTDEPESNEPSHGADNSGDLPDHSDNEPSQLPDDSSKEPEIVSVPFVSGYEDGTFKPDKNVTRAEFLRMLVSALCEDFDPDHNYGTCSFSDIPLGKWYENYIAFAEQKGLVAGYEDGTFHPEASITRAEASSLAAAILKLDIASAPSASFTDVGVKNWAAPAINALVEKGILHGDGNGKFRPGSPITRAEAVIVAASAAGFQPDSDTVEQLTKRFPESPFKDVPTSKGYYVYLLRAVGYAQ